MASSYNLEKLGFWQNEVVTREKSAASLPKGTTGKRIAEAELAEAKRKVSRLEDRIAEQNAKVNLDSLIADVARIPNMKITLIQREQAYQDMAESIRELRSTIEMLEVERKRLLSEDSTGK